MARYCHNSVFLDGVSFEQHEDSQTTLSLRVQFLEPIAKIYFLLWNSLNYPT